MRLGIVSHMVGLSWLQGEAASVFQFGVQTAFQAQQHMALYAPVVGQITGAVFHHAYANGAKLLGAPQGHACFAFVFSGSNVGPIDSAKGQVLNIHGCGSLDGMMFIVGLFAAFDLPPYQSFLIQAISI